MVYNSYCVCVALSRTRLFLAEQCLKQWENIYICNVFPYYLRCAHYIVNRSSMFKIVLLPGMVSSPLVNRELKVLRASVRPSYLGPKASGLVSRRAGRMSLYPSWQGRGRPTTPSDSWPSDEIHILQWWNSGKSLNSTNWGMSSSSHYWCY